MTDLDRKVKEIADGYAALTGRPPGWETYIGLDEYALLREMALKESGTVHTVIQEQAPQPAPHPVKDAQPKPQPRKTQQAPAVSEQASPPAPPQAQVTPIAQAPKDKENAELEMLLRLGSD